MTTAIAPSKYLQRPKQRGTLGLWKRPERGYAYFQWRYLVTLCCLQLTQCKSCPARDLHSNACGIRCYIERHIRLRLSDRYAGCWPRYRTCLYHIHLFAAISTFLKMWYRQDTWSDLQLFMGLNVLLVLLGGYIKGTLLETSLTEHGFFSSDFWRRTYSVRPCPSHPHAFLLADTNQYSRMMLAFERY